MSHVVSEQMLKLLSGKIFPSVRLTENLPAIEDNRENRGDGISDRRNDSSVYSKRKKTRGEIRE